jgi:hypothetical protein
MEWNLVSKYFVNSFLLSWAKVENIKYQAQDCEEKWNPLTDFIFDVYKETSEKNTIKKKSWTSSISSYILNINLNDDAAVYFFLYSFTSLEPSLI